MSHIQVDDGMLHLDDEDVYDFKVDFSTHEEPRRQTNMTVSLIDIAKPARRKGDILILDQAYSWSDRNEISSSKEIRDDHPGSRNL